MPGPRAFVKFRRAPAPHTVFPPGLAMVLYTDPPVLVASATVPGLNMTMHIDGAATVLGTTVPTGNIVPDLSTSTDPLAWIDPINGRAIGPGTVVKDSTAGLQKYIDSTPPGATIILPFDLRVNGWITLQGGRKLTVSDPINGKKMLVRDIDYPWRVQPDLRTTVNGQTNKAYNNHSLMAPWLYDLPAFSFAGHSGGGSQANDDVSMRNPYSYANDGTALPTGFGGGQQGGYDGTTGWRAQDIPSGGAGGTLQLAVPVYWFPPSGFDTELDSSTAGRVSFAIVNPNSGPDSFGPQAVFTTQIANNHAAGIKCYGYVHTTGGSRALSDVKLDVDRWYQWYRIDGIFIDEGPDTFTSGQQAYYQSLFNYIKAKTGTNVLGKAVVLNPGTTTEEFAMSVCDVVCDYEDTEANYQNATFPSWRTNYPTTRFYHIVLSSAGVSQMQNDVALARSRHVGIIYVTTAGGSNPYNVMPSSSFWSSEQTAVVTASDPTLKQPAALYTTPMYDGLHFYTRNHAPFKQNLRPGVPSYTSPGGVTHEGKPLSVFAFNRTLSPSDFWGNRNGVVQNGSLNTISLNPGSTLFFSNEKIGATVSGQKVVVNGVVVYDNTGQFAGGTKILTVSADGSSATISPPANYASATANYIITYVGPTQWNKTIMRVSDDGKAVTLQDNIGTVHTDDGTGVSNWCVHGVDTTGASKGGSVAGWGSVFGPNPAWFPAGTVQWHTGKWDSFYLANEEVTHGIGTNGIVYLNDVSQINGIIVQGPNTGSHQAVIAYDRAMPVGNDNTPNVQTEAGFTSTGLAQVINCEIRYSWGDGEFGYADLRSTYIHGTGRQGCIGHLIGPSGGPTIGKTIDNCTFDDIGHACLDFEGRPPTNFKFTNNCIGGINHGLSISTGINGFTFTGNHSTQADIDAGRITQLCNVIRGNGWGGGGQNWVVDRGHFDVDISGITHGAALTISNVNGLTVTNNVGPKTKQFFLSTHACTNVVVNNNDGGPNCLGQWSTF